MTTFRPSAHATVDFPLYDDEVAGEMVNAEPAPGRCYACGAVKSYEAFARDASKPSGRKSVCRECDSRRALAYYHSKKAAA